MSKRVEHVIERFISTTGWTVLGNDTINLSSTTRCVEGAAALKFDKTDGAANTKLAGAYETIAENFSKYDISPTDYVQWFCYVSSKANVDYTWVRLGTDGSNYVEWRFDDSKMVAGQYSRCFVPIAEYADYQGTGCNFSAITYLAVGTAHAAETDALANISIDDLSIFPGLAPTLAADLELQVQQVIGDTAPEELNQVGGTATAAKPTYVEGKAGPLSFNLKGDLRTTSDAVDAASLSIRVTDVAPALTLKYGPEALTALTAAGSTVARNIEPYHNVIYQVVVAALEAAQFCEVQVDGSMDNSSWGNLDSSGAVTTITANGTYIFQASVLAIKYVRFTLTTDSVGGAVTLTPTLMAGN